jgi:hypothetical protein
MDDDNRTPPPPNSDGGRFHGRQAAEPATI